VDAVSSGVAFDLTPLVGAQEAGRCGIASGAIFQTGAGGRTGVVVRLRGSAPETVEETAPIEAAAVITEATRIARPSARLTPYSP
jgi:hypothetical protein